MEKKTEIAERIRMLMSKSSLTTKDLALLIDEDAKAFSEVTSGKEYPTLPMLMKVADTFDTNCTYLIDGGAEPIAPVLKAQEEKPQEAVPADLGISMGDYRTMNEMHEKGVLSDNLFVAFLKETVEKGLGGLHHGKK